MGVGGPGSSDRHAQTRKQGAKAGSGRSIGRSDGAAAAAKYGLNAHRCRALLFLCPKQAGALPSHFAKMCFGRQRRFCRWQPALARADTVHSAPLPPPPYAKFVFPPTPSPTLDVSTHTPIVHYVYKHPSLRPQSSLRSFTVDEPHREPLNLIPPHRPSYTHISYTTHLPTCPPSLQSPSTSTPSSLTWCVSRLSLFSDQC